MSVMSLLQRPASAAGTSTTGRISAAEILGAVVVVVGSAKQLARLCTRARHGAAADLGTVPGTGVRMVAGVPVTAAVPLVRGLAAIRLLAGGPGPAERAVLNGLITGAGTILSAHPAFQDRPAPPSEQNSVPAA